MGPSPWPSWNARSHGHLGRPLYIHTPYPHRLGVFCRYKLCFSLTPQALLYMRNICLTIPLVPTTLFTGFFYFFTHIYANKFNCLKFGILTFAISNSCLVRISNFRFQKSLKSLCWFPLSFVWDQKLYHSSVRIWPSRLLLSISCRFLSTFCPLSTSSRFWASCRKMSLSWTSWPLGSSFKPWKERRNIWIKTKNLKFK